MTTQALLSLMLLIVTLYTSVAVKVGTVGMVTLLPLIITRLGVKIMNKMHATVMLSSHTFLTNNHVRLHSSQNASDTGNVYDNHLRSTAKIT